VRGALAVLDDLAVRPRRDRVLRPEHWASGVPPDQGRPELRRGNGRRHPRPAVAGAAERWRGRWELAFAGDGSVQPVSLVPRHV